MKTIFAFLLLCAANQACAADLELTPLLQQTWLEQCTSVYSGDETSCKCLLDKQIVQLGAGNVKINLLTMVSTLPDATDEQIEKSEAEAVEIAGDSDKVNTAKDLFQTRLDENLPTCIK